MVNVFVVLRGGFNRVWQVAYETNMILGMVINKLETNILSGVFCSVCLYLNSHYFFMSRVWSVSQVYQISLPMLWVGFLVHCGIKNSFVPGCVVGVERRSACFYNNYCINTGAARY